MKNLKSALFSVLNFVMSVANFYRSLRTIFSQFRKTGKRTTTFACYFLFNCTSVQVRQKFPRFFHNPTL
ncbi:hypothetical protein FF38_04691 [Lucilia cuprina]|uniref:Uncharacterized protein n=1 Tax=Lucilia cuprina TaxID=7375 RepID=A0A0L0CLH9_LUCCU|nr:hypothetical protein FF38_04691 [Lucilia cuprina]